MVVSHEVGRPDHLVAGRTAFEAEVDVVERHLQELFVEAADLLEGIGSNDHARCGHGRKLLREEGAAAVAAVVGTQTVMHVTGNPPIPSTTPACWMLPFG